MRDLVDHPAACSEGNSSTVLHRIAHMLRLHIHRSALDLAQRLRNDSAIFHYFLKVGMQAHVLTVYVPHRPLAARNLPF